MHYQLGLMNALLVTDEQSPVLLQKQTTPKESGIIFRRGERLTCLLDHTQILAFPVKVFLPPPFLWVGGEDDGITEARRPGRQDRG